MLDLTNISTLKSILAQAHLRPKKSLGQNFLVSKKVLRDFIEACELGKDDAVLEVGAGLGTLTLELAHEIAQVAAVELDSHLFKILNKNLQEENCVNVKTLNRDILKVTTCFSRTTDWKIVGSIPYQITSPLLHWIFLKEGLGGELPLPKLVCLIVQKEMAQKITAHPPQASYLSNLAILFGRTEIVGKSIPPAAFWPQPKVESAILRIRLNLTPPTIPIKEFSQFLHHGFSQPRKMLKNVFAEKLLLQTSLNPQKRAQELTLEDWLRLFDLWRK